MRHGLVLWRSHLTHHSLLIAQQMVIHVVTIGIFDIYSICTVFGFVLGLSKLFYFTLLRHFARFVVVCVSALTEKQLCSLDSISVNHCRDLCWHLPDSSNVEILPFERLWYSMNTYRCGGPCVVSPMLRVVVVCDGPIRHDLVTAVLAKVLKPSCT